MKNVLNQISISVMAIFVLGAQPTQAATQTLANCDYSGTSPWNNQDVSGHVGLTLSRQLQLAVSSQGHSMPLKGHATLKKYGASELGNNDVWSSLESTLGEDVLTGLDPKQLSAVDVYQQAINDPSAQGLKIELLIFKDQSGHVVRNVFFSLGGAFICK